jgi:hypothetical protein
MLELGMIRRQLHLGPPVFEGVETIPVAQIIGTEKLTWSIVRDERFVRCSCSTASSRPAATTTVGVIS